MAVIGRQFATKRCKAALATFLSSNGQDVFLAKQLIPFTRLYPKSGQPSLLLGRDAINGSSSPFFSASNAFDKQIIDPLANLSIKEIIAPSIAANLLKVYQDNPLAIAKHISDPLVNKQEYIDAPVPGKPAIKEAVRMIRIRRRKMRKHKLRKLRKRMRFVFAKIKMRRLLRKELAFRSELLTQIEEVHDFDAKKYVEGIMHTLRHYPKPETIEERRERYRLLRKKNLSNTVFITPRFDY